MSKTELIKKIMQKKEFSKLPVRDVELIFDRFDKEDYLDEEKIKLTRNILRRVFSSFTSRKILSLKNKDEEWILKKHLSSRERLPHYLEVYKRIFKNMDKKLSIIDLGSGVNGFSYNYFKKLSLDVNYVAIEAIKQFTDSMNNYFENKKINGRSFHLSLLELEKIKNFKERISTLQHNLQQR